MNPLQILERIAPTITNFILYFSSWVASEKNVGIVIFFIVFALFICCLWFYYTYHRKKRAICRLEKSVENTDKSGFAESVDTISDALIENKGAIREVKHAWEEYRETLVIEDTTVRNTVRPNFFFNAHDLGFRHNMWRHVPGIFVSIGLLLTFLGIIAAIHALKTFDDEAMRNFLDAAKSKFLMSVSALAASIVFRFVYGGFSTHLEKCIHSLCAAIESRVLFHTPEQIAVDQLQEVRAQKALLQTLGNDLGAQIGNKIGDAVSTTLTRDLKPVLDKVGNAAGTEVGGLVTQIGDALTAKLNESLDEMSRTLSTINGTLKNVTERLDDVAERLKNSGGSIAEELSKGIEKLNTMFETMRETTRRQLKDDQEAREKDLQVSQQAISELLGSIEHNTRDNSANLTRAAEEIAAAATSMGNQLDNKGQEIMNNAGEALTQIESKVTGRVITAGGNIAKELETISGSFIDKIAAMQRALKTSLIDPIGKMASHLQQSNNALRGHATTLEQANKAHEEATKRITESTESLADVSRPLADSIARTERINAAIGDAVRNSLKTMDGSCAIVDRSMTAIHSSMTAIHSSIEKFKRIVDRADGLDERLGAAFDEIEKGLRESQDQILKLSEEVTDKSNDVLQSMQTVLDGIDEFKPVRPKGD